MHLLPALRRATGRLIVIVLALVVAIGVVSWPSSANQPSEPQSVGGGNTGIEAQTRPTRQPYATATPVRTYTQPTATRATRTTPAPTVTVAAPQPTATTAAQPPATTGSYGCPTGEELAMLGLINNFRAQNGVGPLTLSPTLTNAAEFHSRDMAARNYFSHDLPGIGTWSQNISNHGYPYGTRAENIAAGYSAASSTFNQWVNSSGHRANMLNANLTAIGIGAAYGAGSAYGTYWTTTFGSPVDSRLYC